MSGPTSAAGVGVVARVSPRRLPQQPRRRRRAGPAVTVASCARDTGSLRSRRSMRQGGGDGGASETEGGERRTNRLTGRRLGRRRWRRRAPTRTTAMEAAEELLRRGRRQRFQPPATKP